MKKIDSVISNIEVTSEMIDKNITYHTTATDMNRNGNSIISYNFKEFIALLGSFVFPTIFFWVAGFAFGTFNAVWGAISPESKDKVYGAIEKGGDWVVDKIDDVGKSIGKVAQGTWNSVTFFFGGGKYAYG